MVNVPELEGAFLDQAVAQLCRVAGRVITDENGSWKEIAFYREQDGGRWSPTTNWQVGGELIERWKIELVPDRPLSLDSGWTARIEGNTPMSGRTALIAAMRALVQSRVTELRV